MNAPIRPVPTPSRLPHLLMLALIAALAGALAYQMLTGPGGGEGAPPAGLAAVYPQPRPLPDIALIAHDGTPFGRERLRGHYTLLFMGYTHCPDVCPTTLVELAAAHRALSTLPPALQPAVVLMSVDPARDTPAVLAGYVTHFDPSFTGLSGTAEALQAWARALGGVYTPEAPHDGAYGVDHSAALFLIDASARLLAVYPASLSAAALAADYTRLVRARSGAR